MNVYFIAMILNVVTVINFRVYWRGDDRKREEDREGKFEQSSARTTSKSVTPLKPYTNIRIRGGKNCNNLYLPI